MPTVTITPALPSVEEGEAATFTVTLNGRAEADIVVTLTPSPGSGSGAAEVADYVTGSVSVTFNSTGDSVKTLLPLQSRVWIRVTIEDDDSAPDVYRLTSSISGGRPLGPVS